ncbi:hypothetical protein H072_309 [Dactylellina haptotyla CBS 200.50]|uniref:Mitochondrial division protein 1 n=1 Tax=Dactylellina haptotyla (strain CBS 200.50) TaxID=1284197 RepID=S8CDC2_DACHA|nr:hypothetical protein H072_309 [Dactylellina haptotyla CBS 200.50]
MDIAAAIVAFVDVSAKVISLCSEYAKGVKNATKEITHLQGKVEGLGKVLKDVQEQLDGDHGEALKTSQKLKGSILDCYYQIKSVQEKLGSKAGHKISWSFRWGRSLKWPFERGEVDRIVANLEKYKADISFALQIDQTRIVLESKEIILDIGKEIDFGKIPSAQGAAFDSYTNELGSRCHPETRKDLLDQIRAWAKDPQGKCIFWLNGMAGTGKSTISRTVAQSFEDDDQLAASFFFKRGESDRENASKFFTTITAQLLRKIPGLVPHIRSAIDNEPEIATKTLEKQFNSLVFEPLGKLNKTSAPLVLVIDALDECKGDNNIRYILHLLASLREVKTVQIRIFLTSRPELPIRLGFSHMSSDTHEGIILQDVPPATIEHDMSIFLKEEFSKIKLDFNLAHQHSPDSQLSTDWPGDGVIQKLAKIAIPLFIFAATMSRFIGDETDWNPKQKLANILEYGRTREGSGSRPGATQEELSRLQLDQTYTPVFKQLEFGQTKRELERFGLQFRSIIGSIVILADPLSASSLSDLLGIPKDNVEGKLHRLHSVLSVPSDPNLPIRLLHLSFREFLVDPEKKGCDDWFWVDEEKAHAVIALRCLKVLSSFLKENICSLEYSGMPREELNSATIDECLPKHVQYSCRFWVHHLKHSSRRIFDDDEVHAFLRIHLLHWLEAQSLLGKIFGCIKLIDILYSLTDGNNGREISLFLYDAKRFLLQNRLIVDDAPLQLYSSAIVFSPETSIVRTTFHNSIPKWISRLPKTLKSWGPELQVLETSGFPREVVFSPDGKKLASASRVSIYLWDAVTGEDWRTIKPLRPFRGFRGFRPFGAIAFSPDSQQLVAAAGDMIVFWDMVTGDLLRTLSHAGKVEVMALSPDGQLLALSSSREAALWNLVTGERLKVSQYNNPIHASAFSHNCQQLASASDCMVELWNTVTGEQLKTLQHYTQINAVTFLPNGEQLASASGCVIRLWDIATGEQLKILEGHDYLVDNLAFSSNNQQLASASKSDFGGSTIKIWDTTTGEQLKTLEHVDSVSGIAFSPDNQQLASAYRGAVRLWDIATKQQPNPLEGHSKAVNAVAFSSDGQQLASASSDHTARIWDVATGTQLKTLEGHGNDLTSVAFSPDGQQLASASHDSTVRFWDVATGKQLNTLEGHSKVVRTVAFSPDGQQLASSDDYTVKLWDVATGKQLNAFDLGINYRPAISFSAVAFSPDSRRLSVVSNQIDTIVKLFDTATGELLGSFEVLDGTDSLHFSSDGAFRGAIGSYRLEG